VVPNFAKADPDAVIAKLGPDRGRRLLDLVGQGADRVFATVREHAIPCDAEQVGWMQVAHSTAMLGLLRARAEAWQRLGRPIRMLSRAEARELTGMVRCEGALLDPSGGMLHPLSYVYGLARAATAAGAGIYEHATVTDIAAEGEGWRLGCGDAKVLAARVLLCSNAARRGAAHRLFRTIVPLTVYQMATRPLAADVAARISPRRNPVADTRANLFTYRLDRDNRLITGGMAILPFAAHRRMADMMARRLKAELALATVPDVEHVWRGTAAMTMDFLPHLYEFGPGFIGGIGCNGRGIPMTAMLGEVLADAVTDAPLDSLPVPVAPTRGLPLHALAGAAASLGIAQAKVRDRLARVAGP
jgi:glycine/D-amino acid oxidase-like deaminating enzyme